MDESIFKKASLLMLDINRRKKQLFGLENFIKSCEDRNELTEIDLYQIQFIASMRKTEVDIPIGELIKLAKKYQQSLKLTIEDMTEDFYKL